MKKSERELASTDTSLYKSQILCTLFHFRLTTYFFFAFYVIISVFVDVFLTRMFRYFFLSFVVVVDKIKSWICCLFWWHASSGSHATPLQRMYRARSSFFVCLFPWFDSREEIIIICQTSREVSYIQIVHANARPSWIMNVPCMRECETNTIVRDLDGIAPNEWVNVCAK